MPLCIVVKWLYQFGTIVVNNSQKLSSLLFRTNKESSANIVNATVSHQLQGLYNFWNEERHANLKIGGTLAKDLILKNLFEIGVDCQCHTMLGEFPAAPGWWVGLQ